jgi:uracil-DNA glycosylase
MNVQDIKLRQEWKDLLADEFEKTYFDQVVASLKSAKAAGKTIYPPGKLIFSAFEYTPPQEVKVVILGQDPYHNPGEAMGLSFSVPKGVKVPASLKNIYKELHRDQGIEAPVHGDLTHWAGQGVLLLNAMLTVEHNSPGSHRNIGWQQFTDAVIQAISREMNYVVFMLWGNFAKSKKPLIDDSKHLVLESAHPSPLAGNAFQGCGHFSAANAYLAKKGKSPIDWNVR